MYVCMYMCIVQYRGGQPLVTYDSVCNDSTLCIHISRTKLQRLFPDINFKAVTVFMGGTG